jgi:hypothetical protein
MSAHETIAGHMSFFGQCDCHQELWRISCLVPFLQAAQRHFKEIKIMPEQFPDVLKSKVGHSLLEQPCRHYCLLLLELPRMVCDESEQIMSLHQLVQHVEVALGYFLHVKVLFRFFIDKNQDWVSCLPLADVFTVEDLVGRQTLKSS